MNKDYYIYLHIKETDGTPFYIGKGRDRRYKRKNSRSFFWYNVVNKHGFDVIFLEEGLTEEEAFEKEKYWVGRIGRIDLGTGPLVNFTGGGEGSSGVVISDETRKKMSDSGKIKVFTNEHKKSLSNALKGEKHPMYGKNHSNETKNKISESNTGKKYSNEINKKKGRKQTEEDKLRVSKMFSRGKHPLAKIILDLETGIYYECLKDCAESKNINYSTLIVNLRNNKYKNLIKL